MIKSILTQIWNQRRLNLRGTADCFRAVMVLS